MNEILRLALNFVKREPLRFYLSTFSVFVSSFFLFIILSLTSGYLDNISKQADYLGKDVAVVLPYPTSSLSFSRLPTVRFLFTDEDVKELSRIKGVEEVYGGTFFNAEVSYKDERKLIPVAGIDKGIFDLYKSVFNAKEGRLFKSKGEAVLGSEVANGFSKSIRVGSTIYIKGTPFKVVGILEKIGQSISSGDDNLIYIPLEDSYDLATFERGEYLYLYIKYEGGKGEDLEREVKDYLSKKHKVDKDSITFLSSKRVKETLDSILSVAEGFSFFLSLISSLISFLGLSNAVNASVLEKRKEIGTLRAIGMSKREVFLLFFFESLVMVSLGSFAGLFLSFSLSNVIGNALNIEPRFSLEVGVAFLIFSAMTSYMVTKFSVDDLSKEEISSLLRD